MKLCSQSRLGCSPRRRRPRPKNIGQGFQRARVFLATSKRFRSVCCRVTASWHCRGEPSTSRLSGEYQGSRFLRKWHGTKLARTRRSIAFPRILRLVARSRVWQCVGETKRLSLFLAHAVGLLGTLAAFVPRLVMASVTVAATTRCQFVLLCTIFMAYHKLMRCWTKRRLVEERLSKSSYSMHSTWLSASAMT